MQVKLGETLYGRNFSRSRDNYTRANSSNATSITKPHPGTTKTAQLATATSRAAKDEPSPASPYPDHSLIK